MRKTLLFLCSLFLGMVNFCMHAQTSKEANTTFVVYKANVTLPLTENEEALIKEVYQEAFKSLVLNNPERLRNIKNILRNRVEIKSMPNYPKETKLLSEVPLFNKYNAKIKRKRFDKDNFNPLSYNFDFYSKSTQIYRVNNTDYYIVIKSQYQN